MPGSDLRILFVGAHMEAKAPLQYLVAAAENIVGLFTFDDGNLATMSGGIDLTQFVTGVPVRKAAKVNAPDSMAWIRSLAPDILLVVGWTQLVSAELLSVPRVAALGFHASLLPKYRGRAPVNWAIINGEKQTGNTMMVLEPGADEGDIVAQRVIEISDEDDCGTIYEKVSLTEAEMLADVLPLIRASKMPRRRQNSSEATVMPRRRPEDGIIDWSWSSRRLYDWIRALTHPYPGAFSFTGPDKLTIWKSSLQISMPAPARDSIGSLHIDSDGYPIVVTGDGYLKLVTVQREADRAIDGIEAAATFLQPPLVLKPAAVGVAP
jgi:methionyl-tRNA formyltransferase